MILSNCKAKNIFFRQFSSLHVICLRRKRFFIVFPSIEFPTGMQTIDPSSSNLHIHNKLSKILKPDNSMFELIVIIFVADSPETDSFVLDDCDCKFCCPDHSHSFETDIFYVGWLSEIFLFVVGTHLTMAIVSTSQNSALLQEQRKVLSCCDLGNVVDWDQDWNR